MPVPLLDLTRENRPLLEEIKKAIEPIMQNSQFIMGKAVTDLEKALADYLQIDNAGSVLAVSSGTDALLLALMALELPAGSEVLTTPFTFFATTGVIHRAGLVPRFVDIDPETFNLDANLVKNFQSEKVRVLMPVHLYGQAADLDPLLETARLRNWQLIEDTAQSIGARYQNRQLGTLGDFGAYSFFPTKNLGAFGDAGLLVVNNPSFLEKAVRMRVHGMKDRYQHLEVGGNFRMDALQAAVLQVKLAHLNQWHEMRRANAKLYSELLAGPQVQGEIVLPKEKTGNYHIYNQFVIRVNHGRRDALKAHLDARQIGNMVYYPTPIHLLESFRYLGYQKGDFPQAEKAAEEVLALPIHSHISPAEINEVAAAILDFYKK